MKKLLLLYLFFFISIGTFAQATANYPNHMVQCDNHVFDLTTQSGSILGEQNASEYTVGYFLTSANAIANTNAITNPTVFTVASSTAIYARVTNISNGDYATSDFIAYSSPENVQLPDVSVCNSYTLPALSTQSLYYTGPGGTGQMLNAGMEITATQEIYIRTSNGVCTVESSFVVTVLPSPAILPPADVVACDSYVLPELFVGDYFTGPGGSGTMLAAGDIITMSMVVYVYASFGGMCSSEESFFIEIGSFSVIAPDDVLECQEYILPSLPVGDYYTASGGAGSTIPMGTVITQSITIYVFATNGFCQAEDTFIVTIGLPNVSAPEDLVVCTETPTGFAMFDLASLIPQIVNGQSGVDVTFHETMTDAEFGINPVTNPSAYVNLTAYQQMIFVRVSDGSDCQIIFALSLIVQLCTENVISGNVKITSGECVDASPAAGIQVTNTFNGSAIQTYTNASGDYSFINVQQGINIISIAEVPGYSSSPETYEISVPGNSGSFEDKDFCISAIPVTDVSVNAYPLTLARPGFSASYALIVHNTGTTTVDGAVSFAYDDAKLNFTSANPAETTGSAGMLTFSFSDLAPSQFRQFTVNFMVEVPPTVISGTQLYFNSEVSLVQTDEMLDNNQYNFNQVAVNSYDPNDKTVVEGEFVGESETDNYLNYVVRFQNTGTASAVNVKITDQLDSQLDWSTFRPVAASHGYQAFMDANGMVTFRFDDINLPATQDDEPGSHGFIAYQVKPVENWSVNEILNTANIYFDFNEPIITNTVSTGIIYLSVPENGQSSLAIYPNPTSGTFKVRHSAGSQMQLVVTDMQGKELMRADNLANESEIDVSSLGSGMYFVKITADGISVVKKLIKE